MKNELRAPLKKDWKIEEAQIMKKLKSLKKEGIMQVAFKRMVEKSKENHHG